MKRAKKKPMKMFKSFRNDESGGTSTLEFLFMFPLFFTVFLWIFETGFYTFQSVMLERGVYDTTRELMLGDVVSEFTNDDGTPNAEDAHEYLISQVCNDSFLVDCEDNLKLELRTINASEEIVPQEFLCIDRTEEVQPLTSITQLDAGSCDQGNLGGSGSDEPKLPILVIFRACLVADPILPTAISMPWDFDESGGIRLRAESAFMNEPC